MDKPNRQMSKKSYRHLRPEGLPVADIVGTSDAFVELTTDGKHVVSTPVIPDNVNPGDGALSGGCVGTA
eukprot:1158355-Pelagomonas_calceolata.AAC.1